jgi:hypothetical protein
MLPSDSRDYQNFDWRKKSGEFKRRPVNQYEHVIDSVTNLLGSHFDKVLGLLILVGFIIIIWSRGGDIGIDTIRLYFDFIFRLLFIVVFLSVFYWLSKVFWYFSIKQWLLPATLAMGIILGLLLGLYGHDVLLSLKNLLVPVAGIIK